MDFNLREHEKMLHRSAGEFADREIRPQAAEIDIKCEFPFDIVGKMAEELFIDYVDIEWGLRARRLGFQSYGVCAALMAHDLGETPVKFMGKSLPVHSAMRHYYHFRNAIWLYRSAELPLHWKCADGWRLLLKYGFYTLFAKPRLEHFSMMSRGILDGLSGRMGAYGTRGQIGD